MRWRTNSSASGLPSRQSAWAALPELLQGVQEVEHERDVLEAVDHAVLQHALAVGDDHPGTLVLGVTAGCGWQFTGLFEVGSAELRAHRQTEHADLVVTRRAAATRKQARESPGAAERLDRIIALLRERGAMTSAEIGMEVDMSPAGVGATIQNARRFHKLAVEKRRGKWEIAVGAPPDDLRCRLCGRAFGDGRQWLQHERARSCAPGVRRERANAVQRAWAAKRGKYSEADRCTLGQEDIDRIEAKLRAAPCASEELAEMLGVSVASSRQHWAGRGDPAALPPANFEEKEQRDGFGLSLSHPIRDRQRECRLSWKHYRSSGERLRPPR